MRMILLLINPYTWALRELFFPRAPRETGWWQSTGMGFRQPEEECGFSAV